MGRNRVQELGGGAEFEQAVHTALQRVHVPEGFAERVLARAEQRERHGGWGHVPLLVARFTSPAWKLAYGAAALLALTAGGVHVEQVRAEERRADKAAAEFSEAMNVTNRTLNKVSARLQQGEVGVFTKLLDNGNGR